jgi:signal transduction histidine kinase
LRIPTLAFRSWLVLLVVAAVLPLLLALGVALHVQNEQQRAGRALVLREKAQAAAAVLSVRVELGASVLEALARQQEVRTGDLAGLYHEASALLSNQSLLSSVALTDGTGLVMLRASAQPDQSLSPGTLLACSSQVTPEDPGGSWRPRTVRTGEDGPDAWQAELATTLRQGPLRGCQLAVALSMRTFGAALRARNWPDAWIATVVDAERRVIAGSRRAEEHVGQIAASDVRSAIERGGTGEFNGRTLDGVPALGYSAPVPGVAGWHVIVGVPRRSIDEEVDASSGQFILTTAGAFVLACCWALVVARWMSREVHGIADGTHRDGERGSPIAEVDSVLELLDRSQHEVEAAALRQHEVIRALEIENRRRVVTEGRLKAVQGKLFDAQEVERRRVARELHDELGQELALLQMMLKSIRAPAGAGPLAAAIAAVERLMDRARSLAMELRPHQLDDLGLPAALRALGRRAGEQSGLPVAVLVPDDAMRLPAAVETALFRVAQGAVTNTLRHAHAHSIALELTTDGAEAKLTVSDDGIGFEPQQVHGRHMGLQIMRERLEALGGRLAVRSAPGAGTVIEARVRIPTEETS